jgi:hypothetical protein
MSERTLQVRAVQPADESALNELFASTLGECLGTVLSKEELTACARDYQAHLNGRTCYVADADGELEGYAVVSQESSSCGPVERLYVRHHGAESEERAVAEALVSALAQRGDTEVALPISRDGVTTALELYDRWGFVDVQALRRCLSMPSGHGRLMALQHM